MKLKGVLAIEEEYKHHPHARGPSLLKSDYMSLAPFLCNSRGHKGKGQSHAVVYTHPLTIGSPREHGLSCNTVGIEMAIEWLLSS